MSANEGLVFTGGDYAIGVHGDRFVKGVAAIHTTPSRRTTNPSRGGD